MPLREAARLSQETVSLPERVYQRLRAAIIVGELAPGELLKEERLGERLGVSRTPVREALRRLGESGLVQVETNRISRVAPLDLVQLRQLGDVTAELCGMAARLAVPNLRVEDLEHLATIERELRARVSLPGTDVNEGYAQDVVEVFLDRCANPVLSSTVGSLRPHLIRLFVLYGNHLSRRGLTEQAIAVVAGATVGDAEAVGTAMRTYYQAITDALLVAAGRDLDESVPELAAAAAESSA
ncbi:GntR family transcriptional regulator [Isoptericola sp. NPDC056134]|uniref:GntR family transcriptional regulator n=1 Tax=Isoptericola sp. NPDC056134 TaxID=3345723 RepID=UPI0035F07876